MQTQPLHYVERRLESLDLKDDHHYAVTVTQQLTIPLHLLDEAIEPARDLLIPLGQFRKSRLPDLRLVDADGSVLPVLTRAARGKVIAILFMSGWRGTYLAEVPDAERSDALIIWDAVQQQVEQVVTSLRDPARQVIRDLEAFLREFRTNYLVSTSIRKAVGGIVDKLDFWEELSALAESTLLIGQLHGVPGRTYVVSIEYTERFSYDNQLAANLIHKILAWMGWIGVPIYRAVANVGQAGSLWVIQSTPSGVEPLRVYWRDRRHDPVDKGTLSVEIDRVVAARYQETNLASVAPELIVELQIAPSPAVGTAMALALFLLFVATYIYQGLPELPNDPEQRAIIVGLASVFAAVPAAVAGALAYGGQPFVRRLSRGPRVFLALLAGQAAFLSLVVSLKGLAILVETSAYILSVYAVAMIGIFGYVQLGPRWRKNDRSRIPATTKDSSPARCRQKQVWSAIAFGLLWTLAIVVFARCQDVLQHEHVFTAEFPGNIWNAWWSWFGL
jgi:hypothetical protein